MIWVTTRQARLEALIVVAMLVLIVGTFLMTGRQMTSEYRSSGLHDCVVSRTATDSCFMNAGAFLERFRHLSSLMPWLNFFPVVLGLLLASPAISDLEQGTYRLIWTQSVSRRRWLLAKMGFGIGAATAISGGLVLLWSWWRGPFDALQGRFESDGFNFEGTVPIAYAIFGFALCLTIGALLRRMVPAAGISIVAFLGIRLLIENSLRPSYMKPIQMTWDPLDTEAEAIVTQFGSGNWFLSQGMVDASGRTLSFNDPVLRSCRVGINEPGVVEAGLDGINTCLHDNGILHSLTYHPADRFWAFQGIETAIFLVISLALLGLTAWWVSRRIA